VIGAGIFGASTAYRLCERGAGDVVLLDRLGLCRGDSGRTFGMVRRHYSNAVTARLAMRGTRTIQNWREEIGVCDAAFVRTGYLVTVPERLAAACRDNVARLREIGLETRWVEPDELAEIEPMLTLGGIAGGAYEPDGGFADAEKMVLGWYAGALQRGLVSGIGVEAREILVAGGRVRGVRTSEGDIACERVVLATGAWGTKLLAPLGVELPIAFTRIQVGILEQGTGLPRPHVVCSDAVTNVVVRPDRGQLVYAVAYAGQDPLDDPDECDLSVGPGYPDVVQTAFRQRYPALVGARWLTGWAGPYDFTPDWNPILGFAPGVEGLYLALAGCGHAFKLSPAVGEVAAAELLGETPPIDVGELRPDRFARGALLRLAYGPGARA
jgi:glycine/D-amino acid oxidase-like deaminating enzyme